MLKIQMLHFCRVSKYIMKLSAVRKVLETRWFLALGSFETLGSKLSHGTSWIAEIIHWIISPNVRTHLRKVSKRSLSSIKKEPEGSFCVIFDTSWPEGKDRYRFQAISYLIVDRLPNGPVFHRLDRRIGHLGFLLATWLWLFYLALSSRHKEHFSKHF